MIANVMWYVRWRVTSILLQLAFIVAPRSAARTLYAKAIGETSRHILDAINQPSSAAPASPGRHPSEQEPDQRPCS